MTLLPMWSGVGLKGEVHIKQDCIGQLRDIVSNFMRNFASITFEVHFYFSLGFPTTAGDIMFKPQGEI